jgi:hypothetical protein
MRVLTVSVVSLVAVVPMLINWPVAVGVTSSSWSWKLAEGVKLTRIRYDTPREVRVLTITPSAGPRVDLMTGASYLGPRRRTSSQGSTVANNSVAGVNGDFGTAPGAPMHPLMVDGELWTTGSLAPGAVLAVRGDGTQAWVGRPSISMQLLDVNGERAMWVSKWNAPRDTSSQVIGYTRRGGSLYTPDGERKATSNDPQWCAARLIPTNGFGWSGSERTAVIRSYRVKAQPEPCERKPLSLGTDPGAVVLAAKAGTVGGTKILSLNPGNRVKMRWALQGWPGVTDMVGGTPQVVDDGVNVGPPYDANDYLTDTHPRTGAGVSKGCSDTRLTTVCKIFFLTVDGRQAATGWSKGMRLPELGAEFLKLKVWDAVNFDGGGSTTMWVRRKRNAYCKSYPSAGGCLVNHPPGPERNVINGLAVLSGIDEATPTGLR